VRPIAFWDELYTAASALTKRDLAGNITSSTIALGEAVNINNFKEVLSLLLIQAGTPITSFNGESLKPELLNTFNLPTAPGEAALDFYTQFSNPNRSYYSWNRSMTDAQTHFTTGNSAYYLGFASELSVLRSKNPTLNLGVALVPQSRVSGRSVTYGKLRALAISRGTASPGAALAVATALASKETSLALSSILLVPSPRRDVLAEKPTDAIFSVFYDSAIQSRGWLDPQPSNTKTIFQEMVESVTSGRARINEALNRANRELETLMR
jgi:ABC-type glycerol-3-phosphate transport system substrate-binding protein